MTAYAPAETAEEIASSNSVTHKQLDKLTKTLFGQYGYMEFALLPVKTQHAIEAITGCQWDMEDMIAAEAGAPKPESTLGGRLKAVRLSQGMTKSEAARRLDVPLGVYQAKESAGTCTVGTAVELSVAFDVSLDYLAGRSGIFGAASPGAAAVRAANGLGGRLRAIRASNRMTQAHLAIKAGMTPGGIGRVEATGTCSLATAAKLADALGVSLDYLVGLTVASSGLESLVATSKAVRREAILKQAMGLEAA